MGTIVTFKPDIDYYYSRGLNQYESDNFIDALKNYREAYRFADEADEEFRSVLEVEMACCYRNLNLLRETQLMYYKALGDCNTDAAFDSIIGLIDVFGTSGNEDALKYYMDMAARRGFSREMDYIDAAAQFFSQRDYRVEPTPEHNMYELGRRLTEAGQYDFARQLLEVIPESSPVYRDACTKLVALYNASGNHEKALEYANKVMESAPSTEVLVGKVVAYYKLGNTAEYESALQELISFCPDDVLSLSQVIHAMAIVGNGEMVIRFGRKLSAISPQRNPMLCYALALCNAGDLREARKLMVTLQALYPYDAVIRVFSSLIASQNEATDFSLTCELPSAVEDELLSSLNTALNECKGDRTALRERLRDPSLHTAVLLVFQAGSENSKHILADIVADIPFFERYMRDCLVDPCFPDDDKRILLPIALRRFRKRPVWLTTHDICRPLGGRAPAKCNEKWKEIYYATFSAVALFGCEDFEREFNAAFAKLYGVLGDESRPDVKAAAALLAHRVRLVPALDDDACCVQLFDADEETYKAYKKKKKTNR